MEYVDDDGDDCSGSGGDVNVNARDGDLSNCNPLSPCSTLSHLQTLSRCPSSRSENNIEKISLTALLIAKVTSCGGTSKV